LWLIAPLVVAMPERAATCRLDPRSVRRVRAADPSVQTLSVYPDDLIMADDQIIELFYGWRRAVGVTSIDPRQARFKEERI
jgi:hypothetical protein